MRGWFDRASSRRRALLAAIVSVLSACGGGVEVPRPELAGAEAPIVEAVDRARAEVESDPQSAKAWATLGDWYYTLEWYDDAVTCYRQAEQLEPDEFLWPYAIGHTLSGRADLEGAAEAFERAVALNEGYAPARVVLAEILVRLDRSDEARKQYLVASRLDPTLSHPELGLGQIALSAGRFDEAITHLNQALRRDPNHAEVHQALAQAYLAIGDEETARYHAEMTRSLPKAKRVPDPLATRILEPAGTLAMVEIGASLMNQGRLQEAEARFREAIRTDPRYRGAHVRLGELLLRQGRIDEGIASLEEAVRMNASDVFTRELLARAYARKGAHTEAAEELRAILEIDPGRPDDWLALGSSLAALGDAAGAAGAFERALEIRPDWPEARRRLDELR